MLRQLLHWELETILREKEWQFVLSRGWEDFALALSKRVDLVSKAYFMQPFDYKTHNGLYGYFDEKTVILKLKPKNISLRNLVTTSSISHFKGAIIIENDKKILSGSYRVNLLFRMGFLYMVNFLFVYILIGLIFIIQSIAVDFDIQRFVTSILIMLGGLFMLLVAYGIGRANEFISRREREVIFRFLKEIT